MDGLSINCKQAMMISIDESLDLKSGFIMSRFLQRLCEVQITRFLEAEVVLIDKRAVEGYQIFFKMVCSTLFKTYSSFQVFEILLLESFISSLTLHQCQVVKYYLVSFEIDMIIQLRKLPNGKCNNLEGIFI